MKSDDKNKTKMVLNYMLGSKNGMTALEAIDMFGVTRLSAVIYVLKKMGYTVLTTREKSVDRYGNIVSFCRYRIVGEKA